MPQRDDLGEADDYRDDFSSDRPRKTTNPALVVGLVLGGVLLLVLLVCGGFAAVFLFRGADAPPAMAVQQAAVADAAIRQPDPVPGPEPAMPEPGATKPATLSRKDFEGKVRDKTRNEVIAAVGRPNETREKVLQYGPVFEGGKDTGERVPYYFDWWIYRDRVINEATGKPYSAVRVRFNENGKADLIAYP
jgi:hypothetical protein